MSEAGSDDEGGEASQGARPSGGGVAEAGPSAGGVHPGGQGDLCGGVLVHSGTSLPEKFAHPPSKKRGSEIMGGEASRPAFCEALFKKRGAAVPIDFGCFLLDSGKQGRKAQQRRRGAQPAERSKATVLHAKGLDLARQNGPARCRAILPRWGERPVRPAPV